MRIAILTESYEPKPDDATTAVQQLVSELTGLGHEVVVVAPGRGPTTSSGAPVVRLPAVRLPTFHHSMPVALPLVKHVELVLREFAPDVVHAPAPAALGAAGLLAARRLDIPSVTTLPIEPSTSARHHGPPGCGRSRWAWLRWVHSLAHRTLVPSTGAMAELSARGLRRLEQWSPGLDLVRFSPAQRDLAMRRDLGGDDMLLVGYVGPVSTHQRVDLLTSVAGVPRARLVVIGTGPAAAWLRRRTPSAVHLGAVAGADLGAAIASMDVVVIPAVGEGFSQASQRALASGVPVVSGTDDPESAVRHRDNGLVVTPGSARTLALAVDLLARDETLRRTLQLRARPSVADRSWRTAALALVGVMAQLTPTARSVGREPSADRRLAA